MDRLTVYCRPFIAYMSQGTNEKKCNSTQRSVLCVGLMARFPEMPIFMDRLEDIGTLSRKSCHLSECHIMQMSYYIFPYTNISQHLLYNGLEVGIMNVKKLQNLHYSMLSM